MRLRSLVVVAVIAISCGSASALTIDGSLADWGVTPGSDWVPDSGVCSDITESDGVTSEDFVGDGGSDGGYSGGGGGYVIPAWGGQDFDMEGLYLTFVGRTLYFGLSTGVDPQGSQAWSGEWDGPGDVIFDMGLNGWDTAVITAGANAGRLWTGFTTLNTTSGSAYTWEYTSSPWRVNQGTGTMGASLGSNYIYTNGPVASGDHNIIEFCFDLTDAQILAINTGGLQVHWTMECGNDVGDLTCHPCVVPEPTTFVLMGLGLAATAVRRRMAVR